MQGGLKEKVGVDRKRPSGYGSPMSNLLTTEQVAAMLHRTPRTILEWARNKKIPCHKIGRRWLYPEEELRAWIASGGWSGKEDGGAK